MKCPGCGEHMDSNRAKCWRCCLDELYEIEPAKVPPRRLQREHPSGILGYTPDRRPIMEDPIRGAVVHQLQGKSE